MNKFLRIAAFAVLPVLLALVLSCQRDLIMEQPQNFGMSEPHGGAAPEETSEVSISIGNGYGTRVANPDVSFESAVDHFIVWVFNSSGSILFVAESSDGSDVSFSLTPGSYKFAALVNGPAISNPYTFATSLTSLQYKESQLLDNSSDSNGCGCLEMFGWSNLTLTAGDNGTKTIPVSRFVAKLGIRSITVDFSGNSLLSNYTGFRIKRMYAINVYNKTYYYMDMSVSQMLSGAANWYNKHICHDENPCGFLIDDVNTYIGTAGSTYNVEHYFYVYQNQVKTGADVFTDWTSGNFTKRCTRMVIEAEIDGITYYYYITPATASKGILRNNTYIADSVVITGLGSKDPDEVNDNGCITVNWSVSQDDWDIEYTINEQS